MIVKKVAGHILHSIQYKWYKKYYLDVPKCVFPYCLIQKLPVFLYEHSTVNYLLTFVADFRNMRNISF